MRNRVLGALTLLLVAVTFLSAEGTIEKKRLPELTIEYLLVEKTLKAEDTLVERVVLDTSGYPSGWENRVRIGLYFKGSSIADWRQTVLGSSGWVKKEIGELFRGTELTLLDENGSVIDHLKYETENKFIAIWSDMAPFVEIGLNNFRGKPSRRVTIELRIPNFKTVHSLGQNPEIVVGIGEPAAL